MISEAKIQAIYDLAVADNNFLENFLENPESARERIGLTDSDIEDIKAVLNANINVKEFVRTSFNMLKIKPPPPPWMPIFDYVKERA